MLTDMQGSGVLARTVLVYGQMNEPPEARWRVPLTALTIAEYFRDEKHKNVLLLLKDNIFRFVQAGSELSSLLGRLPSRVGYQPTLPAFAAENEARMEAMAAAHSQVARQLARLQATQRIVRQEEITAEIIELAAGETASSSGAGRSHLPGY